MKKLQEIEKEYEAYPRKITTFENVDDFFFFIRVAIDDTIEHKRDFVRELRENKLWKLEGKIRNFFFFVFHEEEKDICDEDREILENCVELTQKYREYYERIKAIATEDNYKELTKLVDFSRGYYSAQVDYYDYLRDRLESQARGIRLSDSRYEDNKDSFDEFMQKKIEEMEEDFRKKNPSPQYVKKETKCQN